MRNRENLNLNVALPRPMDTQMPGVCFSSHARRSCGTGTKRHALQFYEENPNAAKYAATS